MRNARTAEWLLSLVMTPERAVATIGDLIEATPARNVLSFWASVISTLLSFVWRDLAANPWRDLAANPWRLGALAVRALVLVGVTMFLGVFLSVFLGIFLFEIVAGTVAGMFGWHNWSALRESTSLSVVGHLLGILAGVALQVVMGRWLARRAPGQEIAACIAFMVVWSLLGLAANLVRPPGAWELLLDLTAYQIPSALPLLVGAALIRRARLTPAST